MKKVKVIFIILVSLIFLIILDSLQALIFDNSPILKIREYYNGGNLNYKDKGIIVDTYCGITGNKDTVIKGFSYSISDNSSDVIFKDISKYVLENEKMLEIIALKYLNNEEIEFPSKITSINVFSGENTIVEFSVRSLIKQYSGFYYSLYDVPTAYQASSIKLSEVENNVWEWEDDGDNNGKTIKIKENWYYYEASL